MMSDYITESDLKQMAEELLDECCDLVKIENLTYAPSKVLQAVDPVAWREHVNSYADSLAEDGYIIEGVNDSAA